jgi:Icc protein
MVCFIHISDTHIAADQAFANYGHRPYDNLQRLIEVINALPFDYDFVLHTGDVAEYGAQQDYEQAKTLLGGLHPPIHYLVGNHDHAIPMQRVLLGDDEPKPRLDYAFELGGVQFVMLDSTGPIDPGGLLTAPQLEWLRGYCTPKGPPLVVALHHLPFELGVRWLDTPTFSAASMLLENPADLVQTLLPARERLRGVFFGHIHRSVQMFHDGILFSSAPSTFGEIKTWPGLLKPSSAPEEAPGYCVVTVDEHATKIQQYTFSRPL